MSGHATIPVLHCKQTSTIAPSQHAATAGKRAGTTPLPATSHTKGFFCFLALHELPVLSSPPAKRNETSSFEPNDRPPPQTPAIIWPNRKQCGRLHGGSRCARGDEVRSFAKICKGKEVTQSLSLTQENAMGGEKHQKEIGVLLGLFYRAFQPPLSTQPNQNRFRLWSNTPRNCLEVAQSVLQRPTSSTKQRSVPKHFHKRDGMVMKNVSFFNTILKE